MFAIFRFKQLRCLLFLFLAQITPAYAGCIALGGCTFTVLTSPVSFGSYNPLSGTANNTTGSVSVKVTALVLAAGVSYEIRLSKGNSTTYSPRQMKLASNALNYNLYSDSNRSQIWGDTTSGTVSVSDGYTMVGLSNTTSYTVYGRIPASQNVTAGLYTDTITISVIY